MTQSVDLCSLFFICQIYLQIILLCVFFKSISTFCCVFYPFHSQFICTTFSTSLISKMKSNFILSLGWHSKNDSAWTLDTVWQQNGTVYSLYLLKATDYWFSWVAGCVNSWNVFVVGPLSIITNCEVLVNSKLESWWELLLLPCQRLP